MVATASGLKVKISKDAGACEGLTQQVIHPIQSPVGTSRVAQWLRIRLPMQGTWVQALVQEDPTCHGATKPASHNY
ncbi:hypothetical protein J1605_014971 [Eschrichtius robustus]|uniref:Uncharacterized protein n=1 Tax=Eschrichtius robustus TaxID=9764 RepID=A0AB34GC43_ESCRO|nr:hypothetical protein J1605_014971 [Eschrichtius robustus]